MRLLTSFPILLADGIYKKAGTVRWTRVRHMKMTKDRTTFFALGEVSLSNLLFFIPSPLDHSKQCLMHAPLRH